MEESFDTLDDLIIEFNRRIENAREDIKDDLHANSSVTAGYIEGMQTALKLITDNRAALEVGTIKNPKLHDIYVRTMYPRDPIRRRYQVCCMSRCPYCEEEEFACLASYKTGDEARAHRDRITVDENEDTDETEENA